MSTVGNFLTIIINTANVMGIKKAAKFPESSPEVKEFPTIVDTPTTAKIIENKVVSKNHKSEAKLKSLNKIDDTDLILDIGENTLKIGRASCRERV